MFGIPMQTPATWDDSLNEAVALGVEHMSCYALSIEPGTPLEVDRRAGRVTEMPGAVQAEFQFDLRFCRTSFNVSDARHG